MTPEQRADEAAEHTSCTCPPPAAGGITGVNRGHLLGCPVLSDEAAGLADDELGSGDAGWRYGWRP